MILIRKMSDYIISLPNTDTPKKGAIVDKKKLSEEVSSDQF